MNTIALLLAAFVWPYGTNDFTIRHEIGSVERDNFYDDFTWDPITVPAVDGGMPSDDTIATISSEVVDFAAADASQWAAGAAAIGTDLQAALSMKMEEDGGCHWMAFSSGAWKELTGIPAEVGFWKVKIDLDYSLGAGSRKVRYSVAKGGEDYTALQLAGQSWIPMGVEKSKINEVALYGSVDVEYVDAGSAMRPITGTISSVENHDLNYKHLGVTVNVADSWGVEGVEVKLMKNGEAVETVGGVLSGGTFSADFSQTAEPGFAYEYAVRLTGSNGKQEIVGAMESVNLFANVDWFGFKDGTFVNAETSDVAVDGVEKTYSAVTDGGRGLVLPVTSSGSETETLVEARLVVRGAYQWKDLPTEASQAQIAIAVARPVGDDPSILADRTWAVRIGLGEWQGVAVDGISTANGDYDVKVELDYRADVRKCVFNIKAASEDSYVKLGEFDLAASRLNDVAVYGGGISALNASFKTTKPVEPLPPAGDSDEITLQANAEINLAKLSAKSYTINTSGKFDYCWKDEEKTETRAGKYGVIENDMLVVREGEPANGLDSFTSYIFGLKPDDAQDKPYLKSSTNSEVGKLTLNFFHGEKVGGEDVLIVPLKNMGVTPKFAVQSADTPTFTGIIDTKFGSESRITVELPSPSEEQSAVRYYRPVITFE